MLHRKKEKKRLSQEEKELDRVKLNTLSFKFLEAWTQIPREKKKKNDDDDEDSSSSSESASGDDSDSGYDITNTKEEAPATPAADDSGEETDWEILDHEGDCVFCYLCLDTKGVEVYLGDNPQCNLAVHYQCCLEKDETLREETKLKPNSEEDFVWYCHYCRKSPGLIADPIASFTALTTKPKKSKAPTSSSSNNKRSQRKASSQHQAIQQPKKKKAKTDE